MGAGWSSTNILSAVSRAFAFGVQHQVCILAKAQRLGIPRCSYDVIFGMLIAALGRA
jgi:hypothetical protein